MIVEECLPRVSESAAFDHDPGLRERRQCRQRAVATYPWADAARCILPRGEEGGACLTLPAADVQTTRDGSRSGDGRRGLPVRSPSGAVCFVRRFPEPPRASRPTAGSMRAAPCLSPGRRIPDASVWPCVPDVPWSAAQNRGLSLRRQDACGYGAGPCGSLFRKVRRRQIVPALLRRHAVPSGDRTNLAFAIRVDGDPGRKIDNSMDIELAAKQLDALGSATRLTVFHNVVRAGRSGISVRRLQEQVGVASASTLSHHLQRLVAAGLVAQERRSTTLICRADAMVIRGLTAFLLEGSEAAGQHADAFPPEASTESRA